MKNEIKKIEVFVNGIFSHTDFRKDVFSCRNTIIYEGVPHTVRTEKVGDILKVYLTEGIR